MLFIIFGIITLVEWQRVWVFQLICRPSNLLLDKIKSTHAFNMRV